MGDGRKLRRVLIVSVLVAVLASPALSAPPAGKASHYPGQDCSKCHKHRGPSAERRPAGRAAAGGTTTGTGAAGSQSGTRPSQGGSQAR